VVAEEVACTGEETTGATVVEVEARGAEDAVAEEEVAAVEVLEAGLIPHCSGSQRTRYLYR
jgi:hypothetical protein